MGRSKLNQDQKKSRFVGIRFTPEEYIILEDASKRFKQSISDVIRFFIETLPDLFDIMDYSMKWNLNHPSITEKKFIKKIMEVLNINDR